MKNYLVFFLIVGCWVSAFGGVIRGVVKDSKTGEFLVGANVYTKNNKSNGTTTGLDGSYVLKNVQEGELTLVCSYISYKTLEKKITINNSEIKKLSLELVCYENELNDIVVVASNKTTDVGVRSLERLSSNLVNIVGAHSIEISPDLNVGNVLGRISGVTLERNSSGEAEYAVIRGMDKRYNITLVNGCKISSPNNKQRFIPLNIFPSELLDRLEVSKTRSADTEGDATGGSVNMVMKDAPYRLMLAANFAVGYNAMFLDRSFTTFDTKKVISTAPYEQFGKDYSATMTDFGGNIYAPYNIQPLPTIIAGLSIGNRILQKKLGFIVAANYQNTNKGTNSIYFGDTMGQTERSLTITDIKERNYSENQKQYGIHAKIDFSFSKRHKVEWYNFLVANDLTQVRQTNSTNYQLFYQPELGNLDMSYQTRLRTTYQQIFGTTLQGEHQLNSNLKLNWTGLYSKAGLQSPDLIYVNLDNLRQNNVDNITIDGDGSERIWQHNSDQDVSGILNIEYNLPFESSKFIFKGGGLFRNKTRDNVYIRYVVQPINTNQTFETIDQIEWKMKTPKGSVGPLTYGANERVGAGYLQARCELKKMEAIVGLRAEYTAQTYTMVFPNAGESPDGGQNYVDFLPNLQYKYSPTSNTNWRASYYRSINKPGFFEIVPYQIVSEDFTEYGNKDLKRTKIDNIDVRWELFPKPLDQILVGAFFKNIASPIEFAYYSINQRQSGYGLQNLGNAKNLGFELDVIKYVRVLGVKANYTFTHSAITTSKVYYGKDENGNIKTLTANQTRPLVGQAAHVGNISLLYKDVNHGWNAQLAASYTGDKIAIVSRYLDSDYWEKANVQLDLSVEKKFKSGLSVFVKGNNLLNTPAVRFLKTHNDKNDSYPLQSAASGETLIRKEYFKQSLLVGVRYKL